MPLSVTLALVGFVQWVVPILACARALRTQKSRAYIVLVSAGGAVLAGLLMVVPLVQMAAQTGEEVKRIPYLLGSLLLSSAILSTIVGVVGVVVQALRRPRQRRA
jgi:hypothetical protein